MVGSLCVSSGCTSYRCLHQVIRHYSQVIKIKILHGEDGDNNLIRKSRPRGTYTELKDHRGLQLAELMRTRKKKMCKLMKSSK
jgi:hypothetical protein